MGWLKGMFGGGRGAAEADEWLPHSAEAPPPRGFAENAAAFEAAAAAIAAGPAPRPAARRAPANRASDAAPAEAEADVVEPPAPAPEPAATTAAATTAVAAPPWPSRLPAEMPPFPSTGPHGHRGRMREKLLERGADALADYELLEMLLFFAFRNSCRVPKSKGL
jgi:DNA repair protein RadC